MQRGSRAARRAFWALFLSVITPACAPGDEGEGYVVLDPQARAAGLFVELDGEPHTGPLPARVPEGGTAVLNGPALREGIAVAPGEVVSVRGAEGRIERGEVDLDQLRIRAAEAPARALAERIGVTLSADGRQRWLLRGRDVLPIAALLDEAKGIVAMEPVRAGEPPLEEAAGDEQALARLLQEEALAGELSMEDQRRERERIARELVVRLRLLGPDVIEVGQRIAVDAELVNQGWSRRWVVRPGDGSEMGWREPYVYFTAQREALPEVWEDVPKADYSRCGNYDDAWDKDTTRLDPGRSMALTERWYLTPETALDLEEPGRVRIVAHYQYRRGVSSSWLYNPRVSVPDELRGTPAFEVVSEPVEVRIIRPLDAVLTVKGALRVDGATAIGSELDLSLVNRSGEAIPLPGKGEEANIFFELSDRRGEWPGPWMSPKARLGEARALGPGESVSILSGEEAAGERGSWRRQDGESMLRVRAAVRLSGAGDARGRAVKSNWVEAPLEWRAP